MNKERDHSRGQAHPELSQRIGVTVRAARLEAKLTQADVAERVGLQTEVYGRLERGVMLPSVSTLRNLGVVLAISSDVLIGLAEEQSVEVQAPVDDGTSPELRRLLRSVRRLNPEKLKVFRLIANALKRTGQRVEHEPESEDVSQVEI